MSDNLDIAAEREEIDRNIAMATKRPVGPEPTGECLHCGEAVEDPRRWCNSDCRDAWEKGQRRGR